MADVFSPLPINHTKNRVSISDREDDNSDTKINIQKNENENENAYRTKNHPIIGAEGESQTFYSGESIPPFQESLREKIYDIIKLKYAYIIFVIIYLIAYIFYLFKISSLINFNFGYFRLDLLPGPMINDRFTVSWVFFVIDHIRILVIFFLLWAFRRWKSLFKFTIHLNLVATFILFDVVLFIYLYIISKVKCNTSLFPDSICNGKDYCLVFADRYPDRCIPPLLVNNTNGTSFKQCNPTANTGFLNWIFFTVIWFVLDLIQLIFNLVTVFIIKSIKKGT